MGLDLLPAGGRRVLEIGVGSGVLVPTLTRHFPAYVGTDLELAPGLASLVAPGCDARFETADLLAWKDASRAATSPEVLASPSPSLAPESFDAIVCFSVLEHIADAAGAARGLARLLARGGTLVTGYPMVSPLMSRLFSLIGFSGIDDHHVSPPARIHAALARELSLRARVAFPPLAPIPAALYQCSAWTKP
jgi:SAM-dependent methyltransferase